MQVESEPMWRRRWCYLVSCQPEIRRGTTEVRPPDGDNISIGLEGHAEPQIKIALEVCNNFAIGSKRNIERAINVAARQAEIRPGKSRHNDFAVALNGHSVHFIVIVRDVG